MSSSVVSKSSFEKQFIEDKLVLKNNVQRIDTIICRRDCPTSQLTRNCSRHRTSNRPIKQWTSLNARHNSGRSRDSLGSREPPIDEKESRINMQNIVFPFTVRSLRYNLPKTPSPGVFHPQGLYWGFILDSGPHTWGFMSVRHPDQIQHLRRILHKVPGPHSVETVNLSLVDL